MLLSGVGCPKRFETVSETGYDAAVSSIAPRSKAAKVQDQSRRSGPQVTRGSRAELARGAPLETGAHVGRANVGVRGHGITSVCVQRCLPSWRGLGPSL